MDAEGWEATTWRERTIGAGTWDGPRRPVRATRRAGRLGEKRRRPRRHLTRQLASRPARGEAAAPAPAPHAPTGEPAASGSSGGARAATSRANRRAGRLGQMRRRPRRRVRVSIPPRGLQHGLVAATTSENLPAAAGRTRRRRISRRQDGISSAIRSSGRRTRNIGRLGRGKPSAAGMPVPRADGFRPEGVTAAVWARQTFRRRNAGAASGWFPAGGRGSGRLGAANVPPRNAGAASGWFAAVGGQRPPGARGSEQADGRPTCGLAPAFSPGQRRAHRPAVDRPPSRSGDGGPTAR
jgi:hypothetical protein